MLLPKIRSQDRRLEQPGPPPASGNRHRKALSCTYNPPGTKSTSSASRRRPAEPRRSASPGGLCDLISPVSNHHPRTTSTRHTRTSSTLSSPISLTSSNGHSRRVSASNVDEGVLGKYGFPTYRQLPSYHAPTSSAPSIASTYVSSTTVPATSTFTAPEPILPIYPRRSHAELPTDLQFCPDQPSLPSTTMLDYLTGPNPTPSLVRQLNIHSGKGPGQTHFWWDIRNLRSWTDFSMSTIASFPGLLPLLKCELPSTALPPLQIARARLQPDTELALHALYQTFYAEKVNRALRVAQGHTHMVMRTPEHGTTKTPLFVSSYHDDATGVLGGARVVGLVKSFDRWNTGMRAEAPHRKVEYLLGLAHLHRHMRELGCRYGFILTEIELVCVRAGTEPVPHFGSLEIAVVNLEKQRHRRDAAEDGRENYYDEDDDDEEGGEAELTAALALWYLHMLAKEVPLPGQPGAKIDVGGPAACTRHKCEDEKDKWIPEPQLGEKRQAKRERGWVFPRDPLHRRELPGRGKRWHK
jgi:hypothetical protein